MKIRSGTQTGYPYSLSRWTDVAGSPDKWAWFESAIARGQMLAIDPHGVPGHWSLSPKDTLGLIFWTRMPQRLLGAATTLRAYRIKLHVTVTGWHEVEKGGSPGLVEGAHWLRRAAETFGPENVRWRFSPVPIVPDVLDRFHRILRVAAESGLDATYVSFLQPNDRVPEQRALEAQQHLLQDMGALASTYRVQVRLCQEAQQRSGAHWVSDICSPPEDFGSARSTSEGCGCIHMVDPFTRNEACAFACTYCYTADRAIGRKHNTTLPILKEL